MTRRARGDGSVHERKDGRWVGVLDVTRTGEKRRRKYVYGKTRKEAQRELAKAQREWLAKGQVVTNSMTVEAWLNYWLTEIAPLRVRETTLPSYRSKIRTYLIPHLGRHRLDRLEPAHLRAMFKAMRERDGKPLSVATQQQTYAILKRALTVAEREGAATRNVAALIDAPGTETAKAHPFDAPELAKVMRAAAGDRLESRWHAAFTLGFRQGECLGLGWDWVDLEDAVIRIERGLARVDGKLKMVAPKSKKSERPVALPAFYVDLLRIRRAAYETERQEPGYQDHGLVWGRPDGRPQDSKKDWLAWSALLRRAKVRHIPLHDARHCAATALALLGVPPVVRMAILGHSQEQMTTVYSDHADLEAQKAAMRLVDAAHRKAIEG